MRDWPLFLGLIVLFVFPQVLHVMKDCVWNHISDLFFLQTTIHLGLELRVWPCYRVCSHVVTAGVDKETVTMLEGWNILLGIKLYFYANPSFCFIMQIWLLVIWGNKLYWLLVGVYLAIECWKYSAKMFSWSKKWSVQAHARQKLTRVHRRKEYFLMLLSQFLCHDDLLPFVLGVCHGAIKGVQLFKLQIFYVKLHYKHAT